MKQLIALSLALIMLCCVFSGCQSSQQPATEPTYNMSYGLDAMQYCLFLNKQSTTVLNQLSTHMVLALRVTNETKDNALESARNSLTAIQDARYEVDIMCPPAEYANNRVNTLRLFDNAAADIKQMIAALECTPIDSAALSALVEQMQTDFAALTAAFNVYYK